MTHSEANRQARQRAAAKLGFYIHLVVYLAVNPLLIFINFSTSPHRLWFQWPLFGWGLGLFIHGFVILAGPKLMERLVEKELKKDRP